MSTCVEQSSLQYLADAKMQFEADSKRVQKVVDSNDKILVDLANTTMSCSNEFLSSLQTEVKRTSSDDPNSTLACFSDAFYDEMPKTDTLSSSRVLLLAVRALLTSQAVSKTQDGMNKQQKRFESHLLGMWTNVDTVKTSIQNVMNATNHAVMKQLGSLAPIFSDGDGSGHEQQSASRLGRLSKVGSSTLTGPLTTSASATSLEAVRKAGRALHKVLEVFAGLHKGFAEIASALDGSWEVLEKQLNTTIQQVTKLQQELAYAAEATASQINRTRTSLMTSLEQAQQEISTSFDILQDQWDEAVKKLVAEGFTPWQRLRTQLVAELTENQRQTVRPDTSIQRRSIMVDRTTNSTLEQARQSIASRDERLGNNATKASSLPSDSGEKIDIDTAVLRASLVDLGAFVVQVLFYVDVGRLTLLAVDLAIGLVTESYSDLPMLDIRGITTDATIGSVCEVLRCRHSLSVVCSALMTNFSELLRALVTFVLIVAAAIVITAVLSMWKRSHFATCRSPDASWEPSSQTVVQSITRAVVENSGNTSNQAVDPLTEIQKYAIIINDSIRTDYATLVLDSAVVWRNQSAAMEDVKEFVTTTSTLVRTLQDCAEDANNGGLVVGTSDASLSSRCLMSTFLDTDELINPSTIAEQLSTKSPFLVDTSTTFDSCFHSEERLLIHREAVVDKLQHDLACSTEKAVYLSIASWWLLAVIFIANRFIVRMIIKSVGMYWWRFLSGGQLHIVAFCKEDGVIVAGDSLPSEITRHLREVKWQIVGRVVSIGLALAFVVVVIVAIFHGL
ncbi:hypothetical protein PHYBOEH_010243 [Phytophthora boehmeriae]|uniref:Transmembrane protein n=1 Tax=Phytophthora boehmeriae TaxID=109152 RepID=A0A8T1VTH7_9STRA|nr:hypothetical protein PHYBOEH_010243 [Phytophthora boehmeriae]